MNAYFDCPGLSEVKGVAVAFQKTSPTGKMQTLTRMRRGLDQGNGIYLEEPNV